MLKSSLKNTSSSVGILALSMMLQIAAQGAVVVTTSAGSAVPVVSSTDLAQTEFSSSSATGGNNIGTNQGFVFNGSVGTTSSGTGTNGTTQVPTANSTNTVTLVLDTSVNTLGYDITGLFSVFGWATGANGRSNQGYTVTLGLVGGSTATLVNAQHWEPNSGTAQYWTTVSFTESGGGTLFSDTVDLNGGGAVADAGTLATGVESITWDITNDANAGGVVVLREFDVFGTPTIPEPSTAFLAGLGLLFSLRRRR